MMYALSILCFIFGAVVFLIMIFNHKKEEEYYDKFYFIVSDYNQIDDYLSIRVKMTLLNSKVKSYFLGFLNKRLKKLDYHKLVVDAGFHQDEEIIVFYMLFVGSFVFMMLLNAYFIMALRFSVILLPVSLAIFYIGSKMYLEKRVKDQVQEFRRNFIYFLDLTAACIKTGMTLTAALDAVEPILPKFSSLLSYRMTIFVRDLKHNSLEFACAKLQEKVDLTEINDFVSTVKNSAQFGAGMHSSFHELSREIRMFHFMETEEKIGKINAKMGIPLILFIMFPIIVEIIAPGLLRAMQNMSLEMLTK